MWRFWLLSIFIQSILTFLNFEINSKGTGGQGKETRGGIGGYGGNVYIKCVNDANLYTLKKSMPKLRFIASHGTHSRLFNCSIHIDLFIFIKVC